MKRVLPFVLVIAAAVVVRAVVGAPMLVRGTSMKPTLRDGEVVFVEKVSRWWRSGPAVGDVVMFRDAQRGVLVKRVVGVAGDTVEVRDGLLLVNGASVPARTLGRVASWQDADQVLPLSRLTAEQLEERWGGTHLIQRFTPSGSSPPARVPDGHVFVLGDNRDDSRDSRTLGAVATRDIGGRVLTR